jgi:hypothetical protein
MDADCQFSETLLNLRFPPIPTLYAPEHRLLDERAEALGPESGVNGSAQPNPRGARHERRHARGSLIRRGLPGIEWHEASADVPAETSELGSLYSRKNLQGRKWLQP